MARDRLVALRARQQQEQREGSASNSSFPTQSNANTPSYEMSPISSNSNGNVGGGSSAGGGGGGDSMSSFYAEVSFLQDSIRKLNENVERISDLHSRMLNTTDDNANQRNSAQLEELVEESRKLTNNLKSRIKALESQSSSSSERDGQVRKQQIGLVKSKFVEAIQSYQTVEQQNRTKYKQRMERQFKIVKPDATPDEVRAVVNDEGGGGQIFQQAIMNSNYGASRAAYREVQGRHQEVKRIEQTLSELAQLFNDMSILISEQDEAINTIEDQAASVEKDVEAGLAHTDKAVEHARSARKKRWICFFIFLIVIAVIAIALGIKFGVK